MITHYNRDQYGKRTTLKNFLSACSKDGQWTFVGPEFLPPIGILGIDEYLDISAWSFEEPWWAVVAKFIRSFNETSQEIFWCIHWKHGWCQDHFSSYKGKVKLIKQLWYTFKCVVCLMFFQWHHPSDKKIFYEWTEVTAYDFGSCYDGTSWEAIAVGDGIVRNWYVHSFRDSSS